MAAAHPEPGSTGNEAASAGSAVADVEPPTAPGASRGPEPEEPTAAEVERPHAAELGSPQALTGDVAYGLMCAQADLMHAHAPAVERADEPEALHELRVDIRRLRAALALFAEALPRTAAAHRERLGSLGSMLGAVRDLDVQAGRVAVWIANEAADRSTLELLASTLEECRHAARRRAVAALASKRAARVFASLDAFLQRGPLKRSSVAHTPLAELAPDLIREEHRKMVAVGDSLGPDAQPDALHALRIRCKRVRYAVEFFEPWHTKAARAYLRRLVALQDLLGQHQDAVVAAASIRQIGLDAGRRVSSDQLLTLGMLVERCREEARAAHRALPRVYARVSGRRWRRLGRVMDARRPAGL